jgi:hypothetical protein
MIETVTIITLCFLLLNYFRPGKTPKLENPLVIERTGLYRITLAPQLNLAQPFIEEIAKRIRGANGMTAGEIACIFEVRDKHVASKGYDHYVLTITQQNGMLYFEAAPPVAGNQAEADAGHESFHSLIDIVQKVAAEQSINVGLQTRMNTQ